MIKAQWLNPRRKRFWAILVVLLYTLLGFLLVPAVVKNNIINLIEEDLGRTVRVEKVEFNPYVLSLSVQGFEMDDSDGVRLASFDEFFVNFQPSSLFRWAWTFREIRLAGPYLFFERFEADDSRLGRLISDFASVDPDDSTEGPDPGGLPRLLIHDLKLSDGHAELKDDVPTTEFLAFSRLSMLGGTLRYPEQKLQFSSVRIDEPRLTAWLDEDAVLSLDQLISAEPDSISPEPGDGTAWQLGIDELVIEGGSLELADQSVSPAVQVGIRDLQFKLAEINNQDGGNFPLNLSGNIEQGGNFGLNGQLALFPDLKLAVNLQTQAIPPAIAEPYVQQFAQILVEGGTLDADMEVAVPASLNLSVGGSMQIHDLMIKDTIEDQQLLGWSGLDIDRFDLDLEAGSVHLSQLLFDKPFAHVVIYEDLRTNLSDLVVETENQAGSAEVSPLNMTIAYIRVDDGSMDFSDLSLPLPFATHITNMDGYVSTIASASTEPAKVKLEGQVDEFGLARIEGSMNMFDPVQHTDITLDFRNLLMSSLSPYTISFAGRKISEGKLNLDLGYKINAGQLLGQNDVVISDLQLGEKIEHPDAGSLPLGLAVALLKDSNGVIDINLPVAGDINDPEFSIGGIVWQALAGMVTKIVSAPFALLGKLTGIDSEDLGQFQFLAGRADLTPPELEKITQLEEALQQRPELAVEISGVSDPAIDVPALKIIRLRDIIIIQLGDASGVDNKETIMLDVEVRGLLELLFAERYPDIPLESLKAVHTASPVSDPEAKPVLDGLAYSADLRDRLLASEDINNQDLTERAQARATAIKTTFLASGQFDESRVVIAEPGNTESEDGQWVTLELAVAPE